jgi:multidrug resistance efflux pump
MNEATVSLRFKLKAVNQKRGRVGFEYINLSEKNRLLLRQYIELYLDGKLDQIDNVMAIYNEPDITTAIKAPLSLNDDEKTELERSFRRKSFSSILLSLLLFSILGGVLYYNFRYQLESIGVVDGNYKKIYPNRSGVIDNIYVKEGDNVKKSDILVDFDTKDLLYKIEILKSEKKNTQQQEKEQQKVVKINSKNSKPLPDREILKIKQQMVHESLQAYRNAQIQLKNHLITKSDLQNIKRSYLSAKESYAFYKKQFKSDTPSTYIAPIKVVNYKKMDLEIANKERMLEEFRIFAPIEATIYNIYAEVGDKVNSKDALMTLWSHQVPRIICKVTEKEAIKLKNGSQVEIIDELNHQKFSGTIKQISNLAFDKNSDVFDRNTEDIVFVVVEPEDRAKELTPYSRVKVLFKRSFDFEI